MPLFLPWGLDGKSDATTLPRVLVLVMVAAGDTPERQGMCNWYNSWKAFFNCTDLSDPMWAMKIYQQKRLNIRKKAKTRRGLGLRMPLRIDQEQVDLRKELEGDILNGNRGVRAAAKARAQSLSFHVDGCVQCFDDISFGETRKQQGRHVAVVPDLLHQLDEGLGKHILQYIAVLAQVHSHAYLVIIQYLA